MLHLLEELVTCAGISLYVYFLFQVSCVSKAPIRTNLIMLTWINVVYLNHIRKSARSQDLYHRLSTFREGRLTSVKRICTDCAELARDGT